MDLLAGTSGGIALVRPDMGRRAAVVGAIIVLVTGCSADGSPTADIVEPAPTSAATTVPTTTELLAGWVVEGLAGPAGNRTVSVVADDGTTVIASGFEGGGDVGIWFDRGEGFRPATVPATTSGLGGPSAVVSLPDGFLMAIGTQQGPSRLWRSDDGAVWEADRDLLPDDDAEITTMLRVGDQVVVGGHRPPPEPTDEPIGQANAALWLGDLGGLENVTPAISIGTPGFGFVADIDIVGGQLLATGVDAGRPTRWSSEDGGRTWDAGDLSSVEPGRWWWPLDLVRLDDRLILAMRGDGDLLVRWSDDAMATWEPSGDLGDGLGSIGAMTVADGSLWLEGSRYFEGFDGLGRCYDDPTGCENPTPVVLRSDDGREWLELDLEGVPLDPFWALQVIEREEGVSIVAPPGMGESLTVLSWRGEGHPPTRPVAGPVDGGGPELVAGDAQLDVGMTVRFPLFTHCGIDYLAAFNDRHWYLDVDAGSPEVSIRDEGVPMVRESVLGLVTLVDEATIEYTLPTGELLAVYAPSEEEPLPCA